MTRHSHQDAVTEQVFEQLVDALDDVKPKFQPECRFVLFVAGRLGLRAGEICHVKESWVDWDKEIIDIPAWDPCDHGDNDEICGYCVDRASASVGNNDDLTMEEALNERWEPKTPTSARPVPFDFSDRVRDAVSGFFFHHDQFPSSRASVNRRVNRILRAADLPEGTCYPHSLRATAMTFHAYRGLSPVALQALAGWAELSTAQKYIRLSGGATQQALRDAHSDD